MRSFGFGLLALVSLALSQAVLAQDPPPVNEPEAAAPTTAPAQTPPAPTWASGERIPLERKEPVGRYHAKAALMSFTLPESWRGPDVVVRELLGDEARKLQPNVDAAVVIDYQPEHGKPRTLVNLYRLPLKEWRRMEDAKTATFGRMTMNTPSTAYVVDRPEDARGQDRFAVLRDDLEDLLITLAVYDPAVAVAGMRRPVAASYSGALPGGEPVKLDFDPTGTMKLTWGKSGRSVTGQWMQRNNQIVMQPLLEDGTPGKSILMHFDEHTLVVVTWDEKIYGPAGARMAPAE